MTDKYMDIRVEHLAQVVAGLLREGVEFEVHSGNGDLYKIIIKGF